MNAEMALWLSLGAALLAVVYGMISVTWVLARSPGNERMQEIASAIQEGAQAYMNRQYLTIGIVGVVLFVVLGIAITWSSAVGFAIGAVFSGLAGYIGMFVSVRANVRTAEAATQGVNPALQIAFRGGAITGLLVVGLGLLGVAGYYAILQAMGMEEDAILQALVGLAFGGSLISIFARLGGGIFTKGADVGADLVGKVEAGIPEDDPRNPAVIADNVGDNVGDVAGMGADLFESYVGSMVAAMTLAVISLSAGYATEYIVLPIYIAAIGIISAIIGTFLVRTKEGASQGGLLAALRMGVFGASGLVLIGTFIAVQQLDLEMDYFWVVLVGLVAGQIIGTATEGFTSPEGFSFGPIQYKPTVQLAAQAESGTGPIIIGGLSLGMLSTVIPMVTVVIALYISYELADFYGVALAAVGMLAPLGITLATDAYGPVADNAGGIAEQAGLDPEVRERTDALDQLGNTTAATGKGFAIGSAMLTALALLATFQAVTGIDSSSLSLLEADVMIGLLIGALMPFIFSALSMGAVGRAAQAMVEEVRRQFREHPGIMDGTEQPDHERAIRISTDGSLKEMIVPGVIAVAAPIVVGAVIVANALGGLLIGSIAAGSMLAIMMANAGGAWDNAKKYIEEGNYGGKNSEAHKAAVVGDTVGDPFKDTSGPSLNILLKLMAIVAVVFGPLFL